jgi:transcriptional regulator with XRE-family HTH domain
METPSWPNTIFGEQLRQIRKTAKLTQEELAFRVNLDRTYISLLERGIKSPTMNTFFRLCKVLNYSPTAFIAQVEKRMLETEQAQSTTEKASDDKPL